MSTREPTTVVAEILAQSVRLIGPGVLSAIYATNSPHMRDVARKAWLVPIGHASDVIAHLERVNRQPVRVFDTTAPKLFWTIV